ncbi:MAG: 16S rRNA methyltransferase, partial [Caldilineaceae bacterium]|nr:16S rRNA methyltransferase [Caldilineaceae bacterium]
MNQTIDLDRLAQAVLSSAKYRAIAPDLVAAIGARELANRPNVKAAVKATKNKLHQIAAAYQQGQPDYATWIEALRVAKLRVAKLRVANNEDALRPVCIELMKRHRSTAERLPILDAFYTTLLSDMAPIASILDLGCGLNPLAIPWMSLAPTCVYHACDIYQDQVDFLNDFFSLAEVNGVAQVWDLLQGAPEQVADVAFLFKLIPCLEQADKQ